LRLISWHGAQISLEDFFLNVVIHTDAHLQNSIGIPESFSGKTAVSKLLIYVLMS
jgi:hypothetical protein